MKRTQHRAGLRIDDGYGGQDGDRAGLEPAGHRSSWTSVPPSVIDTVFRDGAEQVNPASFVRDDGVALLYPRRVNLFVGDPESGKTWASLWGIAQEVRRGNLACVVGYDDPPAVTIDRLRQLGLTEDQVLEGVVHCSPDTPFDGVSQAELDGELRRASARTDRPLTLVVVDSLNEAMSVEGLNPGVAHDVTRFCRGLPRWLRDRGAAVLLVQHATAGDPRGGTGQGQGQRIGEVDGATYRFEVVSPLGRGVTGKVRVTVTRDRVGAVRPHAQKRVMGTLALVSSAADGRVEASFTAPPGRRPSSARTTTSTRAPSTRTTSPRPSSKTSG